MKVSMSNEKHGVLGIVGHVGCGHSHSHNFQTQDDSAGLATVLSLFQEATGLSLIIKDIRVKTGSEGYVEVEMESGGVARSYPRRGVTLQEKKLALSLIGRDATRSHSLVLEAFGRFYGQGIHETPVALQTALANACLDSFISNYPNQFKYCMEDTEGSCGLIVGTILNFDDIPVAVLGTVNASKGGIGPNEDLEGNAAIGSKGKLISDLGLSLLPTIVIEGKIYTKTYSLDLDETIFLVRADQVNDNPYVAESLVSACKNLDLPVKARYDVMARKAGDMAAKTRALGEKIEVLGKKLKNAEFAQEKVDILAEMAILISQDGAGISFMTNKVHEVLGGAGMMPGTSAVFNMVVPESYYREYVFPFITEKDLKNYIDLIKQTVLELMKNLPEATEHVDKHKYYDSLDKFVLLQK